jgi:hypothetical protein
MEKMKKAVEACEPVALTNGTAINHLLSQVEWWHWILAVLVIGGAVMLLWHCSREYGRELGKIDGSGQLREMMINGRYQVTEIPKNTLIKALMDIDTGTPHYYAIDTSVVHGGAERAHSAQVFQVVETHGGDMLQLAELEIIPEQKKPKLRDRIAGKMFWWRKKAVATELQSV